MPKTVTWTHQPGDRYDVTGVTVKGKRFSLSYKNWHYADGINLWRGSVWLVRCGQRRLVKRVFN